MTLKSKYYALFELVSPIVVKTFGDFAWNFFGQDFINDIDLIAETYKAKYRVKPWINNGKDFTESGLRTNMDSTVKSKTGLYVSGHVLAKAVDFKDPVGQHARLWGHISQLITSGKLKVIRRLENRQSAPTWTHADGLQTPDGRLQVFMG